MEMIGTPRAYRYSMAFLETPKISAAENPLLPSSIDDWQVKSDVGKVLMEFHIYGSPPPPLLVLFERLTMLN